MPLHSHDTFRFLLVWIVPVVLGLFSFPACGNFRMNISQSFTVGEHLPLVDQKTIARNLVDYAKGEAFQSRILQKFKELNKKDLEGLEISSNANKPVETRSIVIQVRMSSESSRVPVSGVVAFVVGILKEEENRLSHKLRSLHEDPVHGDTGTDEYLEGTTPEEEDSTDLEQEDLKESPEPQDVYRQSGVI